MDKNDVDRIDFLKMDCEGSEFGIFRTTPKEYLERINKMAIEFHDNVTLYKHDYLKKILKDYGFEINVSWDGKSSFGYMYAQRR